jgi:hypothetical protein
MSTSKHPVIRPAPTAGRRGHVYRAIACRVARQCDTFGALTPTIFAVALLGALSSAQACAQESSSGGEFVGKAFETLHLRETPREPPDFVQQSRPGPASLDYQPLAPKPEKAKKKTAAELNALGADLAKARERNLRAARNIKALDAPARGPAR